MFWILICPPMSFYNLKIDHIVKKKIYLISEIRFTYYFKVAKICHFLSLVSVNMATVAHNNKFMVLISTYMYLLQNNVSLYAIQRKLVTMRAGTPIYNFDKYRKVIIYVIFK